MGGPGMLVFLYNDIIHQHRYSIRFHRLTLLLFSFSVANSHTPVIIPLVFYPSADRIPNNLGASVVAAYTTREYTTESE